MPGGLIGSRRWSPTSSRGDATFIRIPSVANAEHRTAALVAAHLRSLGLEVRTGVAGTGGVATMRGAGAGPTVALRADMDALPVREAVDLPFASGQPGCIAAKLS